MSVATRTHWRLVAPWWHWDLRDAPDPKRAARAGGPVLSKHASTDFVKDFLRDPQDSLTYGELDRYHTIDPVPALWSGTRRRFLSSSRATATETRKLFQPAHQRFYLVSFQLHCDEPGFPRVSPDAVQEVGFVVRRRRVDMADGSTTEAATLLHQLTTARTVAQSHAKLDEARSRTRVLVPVRSKSRSAVVQPRDATRAALRDVALAKRELRDWAANNDLQVTTEAWIPGDDGKVGAWAPAPAAPETLTERWYPAHQLVANPVDPHHDARDATIYFGVVPTASEEISPDGSSRFDPSHLYEIRSFARTLDGDCPGRIVWSEPTEGFRLASFFDPVGSGQRPVDIRLPDLGELEANADNTIPSVRMLTPAGPQLSYAKDQVPPPGGSTPTGPDEICFFAIPLITIVAMFLLNLFLPIILFIFNLWFLLKLKFCIPPSFEFDADLAAEFDVVGGFGVAFDAEFDVDIAFGATLQGDLRTELKKQLNQELGSAGGVSPGDVLTQQYTNNALFKMLGARGVGQDTAGVPSHTISFPKTPRVEREQVMHP